MKKIVLILFCLCLFPLSALAVNYGSDANCMGYWAMEDTGDETDLSAAANDVTETGGTIARNVDKKFGDYSRLFVSSETEWFTHADGLETDISGGDQKLSIVAFHKSTGTSGGNNVIAGKYDTNSERQYWMSLTTNETCQMRLGYNNGDSSQYAQGATNVYDQAWHGLAAVYDDVTMSVYVDGSLDNSATNPRTYSTGIVAGSSPFNIGLWYNAGSPTGYLDGLVDDVAIFDRDLSSVEVGDINTNGVGVGAVAALAQAVRIMMW